MPGHSGAGVTLQGIIDQERKIPRVLASSTCRLASDRKYVAATHKRNRLYTFRKWCDIQKVTAPAAPIHMTKPALKIVSPPSKIRKVTPRRPKNADVRTREYLTEKEIERLYLGHKNIQHTVRYTELAPTRFKRWWKD
jgi:hypothetical protein